MQHIRPPASALWTTDGSLNLVSSTFRSTFKKTNAAWRNIARILGRVVFAVLVSSVLLGPGDNTKRATSKSGSFLERRRRVLNHVFSEFPAFLGADCTLNIYRNLGETMTQTIREHIYVDAQFSLPVAAVFSTCSSLEGLPCRPLDQTGSLASRRSPNGLKAGSHSVPVIEENLGDTSDAERFWTILADGVSWLVSYEGILDTMLDKAQLNTTTTVSSSALTSPSSEDEASALSDTLSNRLSDVKNLDRNVPEFQLRWLHPRNLIRSISRILFHVINTVLIDQDSGILDDSSSGTTETVFYDEDTDSSGHHESAPENQKVASNSITSTSTSTAVDGQSLSMPSMRAQPSLQWAGASRRVDFARTDTGQVLPEYFGFNGSPSTMDVAMRWLGNWTVVNGGDLSKQSDISQQRCARLGLAPQSVLFSKPVLLSEVLLRWMVPEKPRLNLTRNMLSLVVEGWVWDTPARKRFSVLSPKMAMSWFFTSSPVEMLHRRHVVRVWHTELYDQTAFADVMNSGATSKNDLLRGVNVINRIAGSPYIRVDGITISSSTRMVNTLAFEGTSHFNSDALPLSVSSTEGVANVCLVSLTLHRPVPLGRKGGRLFTAAERRAVPLSAEAEAYRPAVILRDASFPQPFNAKLSSGYRAAGEPSHSGNGSTLCDVGSILAADRQLWAGAFRDVIQQQKQHGSQWWEQPEMSALANSGARGGSEGARALCVPELSSDGVVYHWDQRKPMRSITVLLQPKLPVEAPVFSLLKLHLADHFVAQRPTAGSKARHELVSAQSSAVPGESGGVDGKDYALETMLLKRKFLDAARSAVESAKRVQSVRYQMGRMGNKVSHSPGVEDGVKKETVGNENVSEFNMVPSNYDDVDSVSELLREELLRSLKHALDEYRLERRNTYGASLTDKKDKRPADAFKEVTIVEISGQGTYEVTKRIRLDLTTGEIEVDSDVSDDWISRKEQSNDDDFSTLEPEEQPRSIDVSTGKQTAEVSGTRSVTSTQQYASYGDSIAQASAAQDRVLSGRADEKEVDETSEKRSRNTQTEVPSHNADKRGGSASDVVASTEQEGAKMNGKVEGASRSFSYVHDHPTLARENHLTHHGRIHRAALREHEEIVRNLHH